MDHPTNLLTGEATGNDAGACAVRVGDHTFHARRGATEARGDVKVTIRPERIAIGPHGSAGEDRLPGMIERSVFLGGRTRCTCACSAASC